MRQTYRRGGERADKKRRCSTADAAVVVPIQRTLLRPMLRCKICTISVPRQGRKLPDASSGLDLASLV